MELNYFYKGKNSIKKVASCQCMYNQENLICEIALVTASKYYGNRVSKK